MLEQQNFHDGGGRKERGKRRMKNVPAILSYFPLVFSAGARSGSERTPENAGPPDVVVVVVVENHRGCGVT
jgi:hypothetical protein